MPKKKSSTRKAAEGQIRPPSSAGLHVAGAGTCSSSDRPSPGAALRFTAASLTPKVELERSWPISSFPADFRRPTAVTEQEVLFYLFVWPSCCLFQRGHAWFCAPVRCSTGQRKLEKLVDKAADCMFLEDTHPTLPLVDCTKRVFTPRAIHSRTRSL